MAAAIVVVGVDEVHEGDLLGRCYWHRLASRQLLLPRTATLPPLVRRRRALQVRPAYLSVTIYNVPQMILFQRK